MPRLFSSVDTTNSLLALPKPLKFPILFGLLITSITTLIALLVFTRLPLEIPLFYSLPEEAQHLMPRPYLFIVPGLCFAIFFIHAGITKFIYAFDVTSAKIFIWLTNIGLSFGLFIVLRLIYIL